MRIIAKSTLRNFWEKYPDAEQPLKAWHDEARKLSGVISRILKNNSNLQALLAMTELYLI